MKVGELLKLIADYSKVKIVEETTRMRFYGSAGEALQEKELLDKNIALILTDNYFEEPDRIRIYID